MQQAQEQSETAQAPPPQNLQPRRSLAYESTFLASLLIHVCCLVQAILVSRLLGPGGRGVLAALVLWPLILGEVGLLGIDRSVARLCAAKTRPGAEVLAALVPAAVCGILFYGAACLALPLLLPPQLDQYVSLGRLALLYIPLNLLNRAMQGVEQGRQDFFHFNLHRALVNPVEVMMLLTGAALARIDVYWAILVTVGGPAVVLVFRLVYMRRELSPSRLDLGLTRQVVRGGLGYTVLAGTHVLYQRVDILLLTWVVAAGELGLYAAALSAALGLSCITNSVGMVVFAKSAHAGKTDWSGFAIAFRLSAWASILGGAALAAAMPILLPLVYGKAFAGAVVISYPLLLGVVLAGQANVADQYLQGLGHPRMGVIGRLLFIGVFLALGAVAVRGGVVPLAWCFAAGNAAFLLWGLVQSVRLSAQGRLVDLLALQPSDLRILMVRLRTLRSALAKTG